MDKSFVFLTILHYSIAAAISFFYFDMKKKERFKTKLRQRIVFFCMIGVWIIVVGMTVLALVFGK